MKPNDLYRLLAQFFLFNMGTWDRWGFWVFKNEIDNAPELKHACFVLWFTSLYDTIEAKSRLNDKLINACTQYNSEFFKHIVTLARKFGDAVAEFVNTFSADEQIYMQYRRNQWVHCFQGNFINEKAKLKCLDGSNIKVRNLNRAEISEIIVQVENGRTIDETLGVLMRRLHEREHTYYSLILQLKNPDAPTNEHRLIYLLIQETERINAAFGYENDTHFVRRQ